MRKSALLVALFAVACGSAGTNPHLTIDLTEAGDSRVMSSTGQHFYTVAITNRSPDTVMIDSIHLELTGISGLEMEGATANVSTSLTPDESREFQIPAVVMAGRGRGGISTEQINSLQVVISGSGPAGKFTDSGAYAVNRRF